ncbi:YqgE/AlgH family protein, partial [Vibrio parahaemolyticus]
AGQLESELVENSWLTIEATPEIIFNTPINERWKKAVEKLGIDPSHLSADSGHA